MPRIDTVRLKCLHPDAQRRFYRDVLGMTEFEDATVGYPGPSARLSFEQAEEAYAPDPKDLYWKFTLAAPDIDLAHEQLRERGVEGGPPRQVGEIAYLSHYKDPEGFLFELVEHQFEGQRVSNGDPGSLGGGAHLNLLTLRTSDIDPILETCEGWGMKLLSIAPIESGSFTLYFLAWTQEHPPNEDPRAVENRTWVYRRPYTVLEVQHVHHAANIRPPQPEASGYVGAQVSGLNVCDPSLCFTSS